MPSLPTTPAPRPRTGRRASVPPADATPSQLDIIAEINERAARQHRGRLALWIVSAGGAVLLGVALWSLIQGGAVRAPQAARPAADVSAKAQRDEPSTVAQASSDASAAQTAAMPDVGIERAQGELPASAPALGADTTLAAAAAADDRAHRARARRETELRAGASQAQQERSLAEDQARQQREADLEAQHASERAVIAGGRVAQPAPPSAVPAGDPRPSVAQLCAASANIFGETLCHSRECRKAEHANDVICIRIREIDEARRGAGQ